MIKQFTGDKFVYYLLALRLCQSNGGTFVAGNDNGMVGGQKFYRKFRFLKAGSHDNTDVLVETKTSRHFADFDRVIEVLYTDEKVPVFKPYINEYEDNCYIWNH